MATWYSPREKLPEDDVPVRCKDRKGRIWIGAYCGRVHKDFWYPLYAPNRLCQKPAYWQPIGKR